jgi:putative tryptophan/tyrosine transport system substrate-binding protein
MKRREFITLVGGTAMWPLRAAAQQPRTKMPRIGIIDPTSMWNPFRERMRELGYVEDETIKYEYRTADGIPERLAVAAREFAELPVDLMATFGSPPSRAAQAATATIPIVAISIGDPVGIGLVASLARPGGNITGNTILGPDLSPKRLQLLKELIPSASRMAFLWNPDNASNAAILNELKSASPTLRVTIISVPVRRIDELDSAFSTMLTESPDALLMTNDPLHQLHISRIINFLARQRIPGMFQTRENVIAGGFMSYGPSLPDLFRRGASYAHRILQGTKPADLPVEQPTKFELVVNTQAAKALGLTVAESFLLRADEVIE